MKCFIDCGQDYGVTFFYKKVSTKADICYISVMENLNSEQKRAAENLEGPLLILAGAGAGKTKTLTSRIVNLVRHGVAPREILAITFTNKAAKEMRERVTYAIEHDPVLSLPVSLTERPFVSTFHALGVHIIKENAQRLGLPRFFGIYDKGDSKQAVRDAMKTIGLDPKQFDAGKMMGIISREKGNGVTQEEYAVRIEGEYMGTVIAQVWREYENTLTREKALDFDDLLLKTVRLLKDEGVRNHYHQVWKYVHIDEYQDTNGVQYQIARLLVGTQNHLCVVGDIDQNIYSWRGAQLRNILNFEKDYPNSTTILLEENYRSTGTILNVANHIIKKNKFRKDKNLFTKNPTGEQISLFEGYDEVSEGEFIATKTKELAESGVPMNEIAVLYRANFQSRVIEEAFLSYGVSYQLLGTKFFERKEVKDILAYIKASLSPESLADIKRIVNVPVRGIGKVSLLKIIEGNAHTLPKKTKEKYEELQIILLKIAEYARKEKPSDTIKFVMEVTGIEYELSRSGEDGEERLENIRELVTLASRYDEFGGEAGIERLLTDAALHSDQDELDKPQEGAKLMTVHASKGLEFDYVFIAGLEENLFPHKRLKDRDNDTTTEDDEEERRLFYVALTRARKKIYLSYAQVRTIFGNRQINIPSEFIIDIPDTFIMKEEGDYGLLRKPLFKIDF